MTGNTTNMQRGLSRVMMVLSVLWVFGMGAYQLQVNEQKKDDSITIEFSKDAQLRIDAEGMRQEKPSEIRATQLALVFIPAVLMLLVVPLGGWLASGFKPGKP